MKDFDRVARRWGVDYAIKRVEKGKYLLLFKAKQADAITGCFSEYSRRQLAGPDGDCDGAAGNFFIYHSNAPFPAPLARMTRSYLSSRLTDSRCFPSFSAERSITS